MSPAEVARYYRGLGRLPQETDLWWAYRFDYTPGKYKFRINTIPTRMYMIQIPGSDPKEFLGSTEDNCYYYFWKTYRLYDGKKFYSSSSIYDFRFSQTREEAVKEYKGILERHKQDFLKYLKIQDSILDQINSFLKIK